MKKGFTLIELAIVLVIIGVILGAAVKSAEMIKTARAKKNISEITALVNAQNRYFGRTGRFAGDSDNDSRIDHTAISSNAYPDEANISTVTDMDYPFQELENLNILPVQDNRRHATLTDGGPVYYSGIIQADTAGNQQVLNMVVARQVSCLTAFHMEMALDNNRPDSADSASTGRVRAILNSALVTSGAWTAGNLCGNTPQTIINIVYLFDRF